VSRAARAASLAVAACLAGLLAGCGAGSASGGGGPASAVPSDAPIYVEATVRPAGGLRDGALAAAGKVLRTGDPRAEIRRLVTRALATTRDPSFDYARDIEPWLGETAGFWLSASGSGQAARGVAVLSATDTQKAQQAIDRAVAGSSRHFAQRPYGGTDYEVNQDGGAAAVVGDVAAFGTEAELKRTIDASKGGSLAGDARYAKALGGLDPQRLGTYYLDPKALLAQAGRAGATSRQQLEQAQRLFGLDQAGPVAGAFLADGNRLAVDSVSTGGATDLLRRLGALYGTGSTPLLGELPGDAWAAAGAPKLGENARTIYAKAAGALGGAAVAQQLRSRYGIDLEQDVFSWIGDAAFFVRGTTMGTLDGGAVIEVTDQAKAAAAFGKLVGLLQTRGGLDATPVRIAGSEAAFQIRRPGVPEPIVLARSATRVVVAYGPQAAAEAFSPRRTLAEGADYAKARELLGDGLEPAFLLSMPQLTTLLSSTTGGDPGFGRAKPYLDAFGVVATGGRADGDTTRSRVVAGLR
jgi:hypothetical protein